MTTMVRSKKNPGTLVGYSLMGVPAPFKVGTVFQKKIRNLKDLVEDIKAEEQMQQQNQQRMLPQGPMSNNEGY